MRHPNQVQRISFLLLAAIVALFGAACEQTTNIPPTQAERTESVQAIVATMVPGPFRAEDVRRLLAPNRTTIVGIEMFVPTPAEICPNWELQGKVKWRDGEEPDEESSRIYRGARPPRETKRLTAIVRESDAPRFGCYEIWAEKWISCECENTCVDQGLWACDCPYTEPGKLPDFDGWPVAVVIFEGPGESCGGPSPGGPDSPS